MSDCAALLDVATGPALGNRCTVVPPAQPWLSAVAHDPPPLRIRWSADAPFGGDTHPDTRAGVESLLARLQELGHRVEAGAGHSTPRR